MHKNSTDSKQLRTTLFSVLVCMAVGFQSTADTVKVPADGFEISGVKIDAKGHIHFKDPDKATLDEAKARALKATPPLIRKDKPNDKARDEKLVLVVLNRLTPLIKDMIQREKQIPDAIQYLSGMTQIRYVMVFPEERQLVIAGTYEEVDKTNPAQPVGKTTGRPIIQLDDLIAGLRTAKALRRGGDHAGIFGCSIDPPKNIQLKIDQSLKANATKPKTERIDAIKKLVPQMDVDFFNTDEETRIAMICAMADAKLKRLATGSEVNAVSGITTVLEDSAKAKISRIWFETAYQPILSSEEGTIFELAGSRLMVKAGEESFNDKDATKKAILFAKNCTDKMPQLCAAYNVFADLQNIADVHVAGILIKTERLDDKAKWESAVIYAKVGWPLQEFPVAKKVDSQISPIGNTVVTGGVGLSAFELVDVDKRVIDKKNVLQPVYEKVKRMLGESNDPILVME